MAAFFITFLTVLLAEMGDKTQLVTLTLSCRFPPRQVLTGALGALAVITAPAVFLGDFLADLLPQTTALAVSGCFFLAMGAWMALKRGEVGSKVQAPRRGVTAQAFTLVFLAELGDKTQLAAIALTASYGAPAAVFLGAIAGQAVSHALAAFLGARFLSRLPRQTVKAAGSLLFILFGVLFLLSALGDNLP